MKKTKQSLELEAALLKERYLRLYRSIEEKMNSDHQDLADVAAAGEIAAFIATNILKLEVEGLRARQQRGLNYNEQKALRYLRPLPTKSSEPDFTPNPIPIDDGNAGDPADSSSGESSTNGTEEPVF